MNRLGLGSVPNTGTNTKKNLLSGKSFSIYEAHKYSVIEKFGKARKPMGLGKYFLQS
jgi:hypothetical protein